MTAKAGGERVEWAMKQAGEGGGATERATNGQRSGRRDRQSNPPPTHATLPAKLWETSTSKTLSQTALTIQSPSSNS